MMQLLPEHLFAELKDLELCCSSNKISLPPCHFSRQRIYNLVSLRGILNKHCPGNALRQNDFLVHSMLTLN